MLRTFLLAFFSLGLANALADEAPPNRLISEAIPAWQKLKTAEERVNFTMHEARWATEHGRSLDHWTKRSQKRLVRDGSSFLTKASAEGSDLESYFAANPRYLFNVSRPSKTGPYTLRQLDLNTSDEARADLERQLVIFYSMARWRLLASIPLEELVTDPGFQLKQIEGISVDGLACVKVRFAGALTRHKQTFLDSWVIFDPARDWSIVGSETNFERYKSTMENEYWSASGGVSWLRRCRMTSIYPAEQIVENHEYRFDKGDPSPISASTFLLSSFGMPEPDRPVAADHAAQLEFLPANRDLGPVAVGELRKVAFRAINHDDSRPARILGIEQHCDIQGCIIWRGTPTTLPPSGEATFEVEWKGMKPGRLVQQFPVYTDCPGQAEVRLTISGDVISDQGSSPP